MNKTIVLAVERFIPGKWSRRGYIEPTTQTKRFACLSENDRIVLRAEGGDVFSITVSGDTISFGAVTTGDGKPATLVIRPAAGNLVKLAANRDGVVPVFRIVGGEPVAIKARMPKRKKPRAKKRSRRRAS